MFGINFNGMWESDIMREKNLSEEELSVKERGFEEWVLNVMREMATNNRLEVKFNSYRTARVYDALFDAERESMRPLEYMLAIKADARPDNHTVYEIRISSVDYYIWFHDDLCRIGKTIVRN